MTGPRYIINQRVFGVGIPFANLFPWLPQIVADDDPPVLAPIDEHL
jgi:hypothetical protein